MTTYYKATRRDGTDFWTGELQYGVGQTVTHPRSKRYSDMIPNAPGTYLSVSVEPGEVLTGGWWPCRLFRVEPVGRTTRRTDGMFPHKRGCRALRVVEELPAHLALGPNGGAVAALIDRAARLTPDEHHDLKAARAAAWGAARVAAGDAAWVAARNAAQDAAGGAAQGAAWGAAWDAARAAAAGGAAWDAARAAAWGAAWDAARAAAGGAAWALMVRDLISVEHFDLLYGPWRSVVEEAA